MNRLLLLGFLVVFAVVVPSATFATAAPDQTGSITDQQVTLAQTDDGKTPTSASGFLTTFRKMEGTEAFRSYSEFEIIRSQAVMAVQVGEFTETEQRRMRLILRILRTFQRGYAHQQNGSYAAAIASANKTNALIEELRRTDGGERYATLADLALERFYARIGQALQSRAEAEDTTPKRIETLRRALLAYQRAGATERYSNVLVRVDSLEKSYNSDVSTINESASAAASVLNRCSNCQDTVKAVSSYRFRVFSRYQRTLQVTRDLNRAIELANNHGLEARVEKLQAMRADLTEIRRTLMFASIIIFAGYAAVLGTVGALIGWRLTVWRRDLEAATRGDSILVGAMLRD